MLRNSTNTLKVFAFNHNTAHPQTGDAANITCKVSLDGAAAVALADTNPTEMEDGFYLFNVTAAESNGVTADFFPESTTNNVQVICAEHNRYLLPQGGVATLNNQNSIISAIAAAEVTVTNQLAANGTLTLYNNREYGGAAHSAITFNVAKDYTGATSLELSIYDPSSASTEYESLTATANSSTLISVTGSVDVTDTYFGGTGKLEARYSLFANWSTNQETIATGRAVIFQQPE